MTKSKKIIIGTIAGLTAAAVCVTGGILLWRNFGGGGSSDGIAYVSAVTELNTAAAINYDLRFSGVVEPQETKEIKVDLSKQVSEILVEEGAHVEAGDPLFSYDVESMQLELDQGNVEIERMQNEITSSQQQITQLETERKNASADDKLSYTTQIQSLETDIAKTEYDIKTKKLELEKLNNTIQNAAVNAEITGTVQSLKTVEQLQSDGTDVLMKVVSDGEFRVKCTASEQNMYMIYADEAVTVQSRVDDTTWTGTITEIGTEPETNQNEDIYGYGGDASVTASEYPFYITLDSSDGLMLGQHLLVSPDMGETMEKSGIWLYTDYVVTDEDGKSYVWADNGRDRLEKREVELGQSDEMMGDCEIVSGLSEDDLISYPSDAYEEGMRTTTNMDEVPVEDEFNDGDIDPAMGEEGVIDGEGFDPAIGEEGVIDGEGIDPAMGEDGVADSEEFDPAMAEDGIVDGEAGDAISEDALEGGDADGN